MSKKPKTRKASKQFRAEMEMKERRFSLTERRFALARGVILLILTVGLAVTAIICALRGSPWQISTGTGGLGAVTHLLGSVRRPR